MKAKKSKNTKKQKKVATLKKTMVTRKQKSNLFMSSQAKNKQLENYKAFFKHLLSNDIDDELAGES
jgi:hypothetical protein